MPKVYLSLGSNQNKHTMLRRCHAELMQYFPKLTCSPVYENPPVGFTGDDFYNCVLAFDTALPLAEVQVILKTIQKTLADRWDEHQFNNRAIDIDLLLYGDYVAKMPDENLPRTDITEYAFVLKPLVDIAANEQHPALQKTFAELWQAFDQDSHSLTRVNFTWSLD